MKISFLGAAKLVTGSNYLIETENCKFVMECGMFQGSKTISRLNYQPFAYNPGDIDFMLLSHAHIDHSGRIPKLVKDGFKGKIYCTKATADLCSIMLPDSGHIQEMETKWDNRKRKRSGGKLRKPLYTVEEAKRSLELFNPVLYNQIIKINDEITVRFKDAGHILGSAVIELWVNEGGKEIKLVFSGDLGRRNRPILRDLSLIGEADYVIVESTYGNKKHHPSEDDARKLISIINSTVKRGGNVVIPSFAVERAQDIIYELNKYYDEFVKTEDNDFLNVPVYIDSPLTVSATEIFRRNPDCFDEKTLEFIRKGDNPLDFHNLIFTRNVGESKQINISRGSKVIISASGMCTAGRIKHHLKHNLWRSESSIVFVGYQANGTLGRRLKEGEKSVKLFGEEIQVNAKICSLDGFSGHADKEGIMWWLKGFNKKPKKIFIVHGEEEATREMSKKIEEELNIETYVPELGETLMVEGEVIISGEKISLEERSKQYNEIEESLEKLKSSLYPALQKLEQKSENGKENGDLVKIKNKLIQLQKESADLNMLLTDKLKENG
ncbi:MAG: MBL fold metallo-hydrolase [Candidatus Caldatribacteriota bacterium]|nr:MBL fold metallo-hydrolase [Candidatus Caldatribacteriota bacterium]